jgi:hypothetical protein
MEGPADVGQAVRAGATGYLITQVDEEALTAIRTVASETAGDRAGGPGRAGG